jgi:hypothetical protein
MDLYGPPDELDAATLRSQLAREIGIPESVLAKTRIASSARFIIIEEEETSEPLPPSSSQYLVGKYLEVVVTVERHGFEIAELKNLGGGMIPFTPTRRPEGALSFDEGAGLLNVLSPENRAVVIDSFIRRLSNRRRHRYIRCRFCKTMTAPESTINSEANVCDGCAVTELGIVF